MKTMTCRQRTLAANVGLYWKRACLAQHDPHQIMHTAQVKVKAKAGRREG